MPGPAHMARAGDGPDAERGMGIRAGLAGLHLRMEEGRALRKTPGMAIDIRLFLPGPRITFIHPDGGRMRSVLPA